MHEGHDEHTHDDHEGHSHDHGEHTHSHEHEGHTHEHNHDEHEHHDHSDYDHDTHDHAHDAEIDALEAIEPGVVAVAVHEHDGAIVASGALILYTDEPHELRHAIADELEFIAAEIGRCGGVVGHVKASFVATSYDILSVTEAGGEVELKRAPELEIKIGVAAIAFEVPAEFVKNLVGESLQNLLD